MRTELPLPTRRAIVALAAAQGTLLALLGWARYSTFHNETFDLAFYTRIAWGLSHLEFWEPMLDAHFYGLHLTPVLLPLGAIGAIFGTPAVLIVAQASALALATFPLARIGARHLGPTGALLAALAWLLYPNLGHVASYEVHPGVMAALPLAWIAYAVDSGSRRAFFWGSIGVLLCREDLALMSGLAAGLFGWTHPGSRRLAAAVAALALLWFLFFALYLHPTHAPANGSLQLHFGRFGNGIGEVALYLLTHPLELGAHLLTPERLAYVPKVVAPLALLPLLRPKWWIPTLPIFGINLISEWPTTTQLDVQYLTPALPFLVAGALEAAAGLEARWTAVPSVLAVAILSGHAIAGGTPVSLDYPRAAFTPDADTMAARALTELVPADASVQAPYALLPHFAERKRLYRTSSPECNADWYVLDIGHRRAYSGREDLIRTAEEPPVRDWLAREDHRIAFAGGDLLLLERSHHPREGWGARAIVGRAEIDEGRTLTACLALAEASLSHDVLTLRLVARGPCPSDLALRIGVGDRPERVDLIAAGWLSPRHFQAGDLIESRHRVSPAELAAYARNGLRIGAIRQSGARPEHDDPNSIPVSITRD